ncbi:MAG TPA: hypothetical protein VFK17_00325 [Gaiellaceae bacterium]|nr:hypothetical protein [Gaiellaceae bacterium]
MTVAAEPRRLFALDQNFPLPIVDVLSEFMAEAELVPIAEIDARLSDLDDWEVLLALHHHNRAWDGLITTDSGMLSLPRELSVLMQTHLTLVVAEAAGHDPLKATGLVLTYLPWIANQTRPDSAQLWVLRAANKPPEDPWDRLTRIAARRETTTQALYNAERLTRDELNRDPLEE